MRVIDAFIDELKLVKLGFDGVRAEGTGRPGYHAWTWLRNRVYGYMNRIQSSRPAIALANRVAEGLGGLILRMQIPRGSSRCS